jgi:hypothetical protein
MASIAKTASLVLLISVICYSQDHQKTEKEVEKEIEQAFRSAYSNRSEEIGDFFNKTFGPGGDADEIGHRFQTAWKSASEGVRRFVNETYWNISKTMQGDDETNPSASLEEIYALVSHTVEEAHKKKSSKHGSPTDAPEEKVDEHKSILDTAWNYFKSVFGVSTKGEPPVAGLTQNAVPGPRGGMTLGILTLLAGVILLVQAGLNRNSWINKPVAESPTRSQVPSGYVRIM